LTKDLDTSNSLLTAIRSWG